MNLYVLVEGKTERKVYPKWLSYFLPSLERVYSPEDVSENSFYLISGGGYPSILDNHLVDSANDINNIGKFNYLILAIDTDEVTDKEKIKEVHTFISENNITLNNCNLVIIPQTVCMETWFLGNKKIYSRNSINSVCAQYAKHYDISRDNPELMIKHQGYSGTNADYHFSYLKTMLAEKNIHYTNN